MPDYLLVVEHQRAGVVQTFLPLHAAEKEQIHTTTTWSVYISVDLIFATVTTTALLLLCMYGIISEKLFFFFPLLHSPCIQNELFTWLKYHSLPPVAVVVVLTLSCCNS